MGESTADSNSAAGAIFTKCHALIVGTGRYIRPPSDLDDVPSVERSVHKLSQVLTDVCKLGKDAVRVLVNPTSALELGDAVVDFMANAPKDAPLLFCYVGHGLPDGDNNLCLAVSSSNSHVEKVGYSAYNFGFLRRHLRRERFIRPVFVMLDCCFSGRALEEGLSAQVELKNIADIAGVCVLTSSGPDELALAPKDAPLTAFMGTFTRLLEEGHPQGPEEWTLTELYNLAISVQFDAGHPRPHMGMRNSASSIRLCANPMYRPPKAAEPESPPDADGAVSVEAPYMGLYSYEEKDAHYFFGRRVLLDQFLELVRERVKDPHLLLVSGSSGSGKSSLVRAGLLPAVARGDLGIPRSKLWQTIYMTPTAQPVRALADEIQKRTIKASSTATTSAITDAILQEPTQLAEVLKGTVFLRPQGENPTHRRPIVVVDQFEDVFRECKDESEQLAFIRALSAIGSGEAGLTGLVILVVRSDFLDACSNVAELAPVIERTRLVVGPMGWPEVTQVIEEPAGVAGARIEPGLLTRLYDDLGFKGGKYAKSYDVGNETSRLPLLSHALLATWYARELRSDGIYLTLAGYQGVGEIRGALNSTARKVMKRLPGAENAARRIFLQLVHVGESSDNTRRRMSPLQFNEMVSGIPRGKEVAEAFAAEDARLITMDATSVQITHEALLTAWSALAKWIQESREDLLKRRPIDEAAKDWDAHRRDSYWLFRGPRLTDALEWKENASDVDLLTVEFLKASVDQRQREDDEKAAHELERKEAERKLQRAEWERERSEKIRRRLKRTALVAVAVAAAVAVVGGVAFAIQSWRLSDTDKEKERANDLSVSRSLIGLAQTNQATDPVLALRLAVAAVKFSDDPVSRSALFNTLTSSRVSGSFATGAGDGAAVAWSPDGRTVAVSAADNGIHLWVRKADGGFDKAATLTGHKERVVSLAWSPKAQLLASSALDGSLILWDTNDPHQARRVSDQPSPQAGTGLSMSWSPDGQQLATGDNDGYAAIWNVPSSLTTGSGAALLGLRHRFPAHKAGVVSLAFSPDGRMLATGSWDKTAAVWSVGLGERASQIGKPLTGFVGTVLSVSWSSDGGLLATATSTDNVVVLWDMAIPAKPVEVQALEGHTDAVVSAQWAPRTRVLATASADGTVLLWAKHPDGWMSEHLGRHQGPVSSIAWSANGDELASTSSDDTVLIWRPRMARARLRGEAMVLPLGDATALTWSAGSPHLAIGASNGDLTLWSLEGDKATRLSDPVNTGTSAARHMAWSPDHMTLVVANADNVVTMWNTSDPQSPKRLGEQLLPHAGELVSVQWTSDGRARAVEALGNTSIAWNVTDNGRPSRLGIPLVGHTAPVTAAQWSHDGQRLATVSADGTAKLWTFNSSPSTSGAQSGDTLVGHNAPVTSVAWSRSGKLLLTGAADGEALLWDTAVQPARRLGSLGIHAGAVTAVAWSPDNLTIAVAGKDHAVALWDVTNVDQPRQIGSSLDRQASEIASVAWSPDSMAIASPGAAGSGVIWSIDEIADLRQRASAVACVAAGGALTNEQWTRFVSAGGYRDTCS